MPPELQVTTAGATTLVTIGNRSLDESNAAAVTEALLQIAAGLACPRLRLDLAAVAYVNSTALDGLVRLHKRVQTAGGELTLDNVGPVIYEVFEVTGLTRLFTIRQKSSQSGTAAS